MHTVSPVPVPLLSVTVSAGFPSPAAAYAAKPLVLDDWLWPARASCQLAPWDGGRSYLVLDSALSPVVGDILWRGEEVPLMEWPEPLEAHGSEESVAIVVAATIRLYRRRPSPGCHPPSIHDWLIRRPYATYLIRAEGRSMVDYGIFPGSLLVVDRSCALCDGDIVIAGGSEGFLVKQYRTGPARLIAGNPLYPDILLQRAPQYGLDGVVVASLTRHRGCA